MNGQVLVDLAASAIYLTAGLWAWQRRENRPGPARLAGVLCMLGLTGSAGSLVLFLAQPQDGLIFAEHLPAYMTYVSALVLLMLTRSLVDLHPVDLRWIAPGLAWGGIILAIDSGLLAFPELVMIAGGRVVSRAELMAMLLTVGWSVLMLGSVWVTARALRKSPRRTILLSHWALVLLMVVVAEGMILAGQEVIGGLMRPAAVVLAVYVVTHLRLPALDHTLRRVIASLVFIAIAIGIYAAALTAAQLLFQGWNQLSPLAISLIVSAGLVLLFTGVLQRLYKWTRRTIAGGRRDPASALRRYSQNITGTLDLDRLAALAAENSSKFLDARCSYFFMVDFEKGADGSSVYVLRCVRGIGGEDPTNGCLLESSPLAMRFRSHCRPVLQEEIDILPEFSGMPADEVTWLEELGAEAYAPICAKGEWIGLMALGQKTSGLTYTPRDLALLGTLADQTAIALENTRLVEGLLRLNNEFRRAYAALDQANQHLERLDKTKSDFISIASHELRTPLTLINGASQMLLDDPDLPENPYHQQLLQKIKAGGDRLHEIVETMLDMAKIDQRTLELEPQPVAPAGLIESVVADVEKAISERKQTIEVDVPRDLPAVTADMIALRKVFFHLVSNAVKYTPDGGRIRIVGRKVEPNASDLPHGGVEIVVSDNGIGIDPRFHELIFAKFYQTGELALHSTGKTKFKGSGPGLGLAIARGIVAAHHGRIWVESPGYDEETCPGSDFHVMLPLRLGGRPLPPPPIALNLKA